MKNYRLGFEIHDNTIDQMVCFLRGIQVNAKNPLTIDLAVKQFRDRQAFAFGEMNGEKEVTE